MSCLAGSPLLHNQYKILLTAQTTTQFFFCDHFFVIKYSIVKLIYQCNANELCRLFTTTKPPATLMNYTRMPLRVEGVLQTSVPYPILLEPIVPSSQQSLFISYVRTDHHRVSLPLWKMLPVSHFRVSRLTPARALRAQKTPKQRKIMGKVSLAIYE